MGSQLQRETSRHTHSRRKHGAISHQEAEQREIYFTIAEAPEKSRGKRNKMYNIRIKESNTEETIEPKRVKPYTFSVPGTMEICPYLRNITQIEEESYNGTCALRKTPCLNHYAYPIGGNPNCKPYNTVWNPQTVEQFNAVRNASANDLVTFLDESEIVRLLKEEI
jgi:hypothetical protein